jgi:putative transposase
MSTVLRAVKEPVAKKALVWTRRHAPHFLPAMADVQPRGRTTHRFRQRGGGYDRNLRSAHDVHEKLQYIHENPVRRGLVATPGDWYWSIYRAWEQRIDQPISIDRATCPILNCNS